MFRHWITSIDYPKLIEMQAKQECACLSKKEIKAVYKNPSAASQSKKIIKIGKRR